MKGLLSRGNLILGISWAMALSVFVVRGGRPDVGGPGTVKATHAPTVQLDAAVPAAAVIAAPAVPDEALSRNDATRTLQ